MSILNRLQKSNRTKPTEIQHNSCFDIVVTQQELNRQLMECSTQTNLLKLLVLGKELPDYEICLLKVSLKFELIGNLIYSTDENCLKKPEIKAYIRELFQGSYETVDEVKQEVELLTDTSITEEDAKKVFRKLLFVIYTCCPCMADISERWWSNTYRCFIEYAIEHDSFFISDCSSIYKAYPKDMPNFGNMRNYVFSKIPKELVEQVINSDLNADTIKW